MAKTGPAALFLAATFLTATSVGAVGVAAAASGALGLQAPGPLTASASGSRALDTVGPAALEFLSRAQVVAVELDADDRTYEVEFELPDGTGLEIEFDVYMRVVEIESDSD